jgi:putative transcriptional regulator
MSDEQISKKESPLKRRREELGLTQRDIAVAIDISVQTMSNWETGRYGEAKLTLSQIKALCQVLKWTIEDLPEDFRPLSGWRAQFSWGKSLNL